MKPNIVFILTDDQGWNALSTRAHPDIPGSGSTYFRTPRLDAFAKEGMRFSQAYAPAPTCSPTRHAVQFGRSPTSLKIWGADGIEKENVDAVPSDSLAQVIKQIDPDYATAHFGKWHISFTPDELGYDDHDGTNMNQEGNSDDPDDPKRIFSLTRRSEAFIEKMVRQDRPFFLQISHYANHLMYQARKSTLNRYKTEYADDATKYHCDPLWGAMNEDLDAGIGMILDAIERLGIRDSTYVIFTGDNGYENKTDFLKPIGERGYYKAWPQKSHKYTVSEGGLRVPFIIRGPDIPAGFHSTELVVGIDIYTTIVEILGGQSKVPEKVEGASLLKHVTSAGKEAIRRKDPFLVFKYTKPRPCHDICIVQGKYKLLKDIDTSEIFLHDLDVDIGEKVNIAEENPELTASMYREMTAYFDRFGWDESMIEGTYDDTTLIEKTKKVRESFLVHHVMR